MNPYKPTIPVPSNLPKISDLVVEIRKVVEEDPEHVYHPINLGAGNGCRYTKSAEGPDGCLVGQALMRLGVPRDYLEKIEEEDWRDIAELSEAESDALPEGSGFPHVFGYLVAERDEADEEIVKWISDVQEAQDTGSSWENATSLPLPQSLVSP